MAHHSKGDRVNGLAAEVAFFSLLSVFPGLLTIAAGLGALDSLFGSALLARAQTEVITVLETFLTDNAAGTTEAIEALFQDGSGGVFTFGVVVAVWAASRGMSTVMRTLVEIYDVEDTRSVQADLSDADETLSPVGISPARKRPEAAPGGWREEEDKTKEYRTGGRPCPRR